MDPVTPVVAAALALAAQLAAQQEIEQAVLAGIETGVYPGAVVVIGTGNRVLLAKGYGALTWSEGPPPDPDSTLYDLASLTKVVATTPAVLLLVDRGLLALDRPVQRYLSEFAGAGKSGVTVRHLLEHRSGLPAWLRLDTLTRDAADARRAVLREALRHPPGGRVVYSDLNAMLLGWIVERISGRPLDEFVTAELFAPLGMHETRFRPPQALRHRIAPVGLWRGQPIAGEVHDQNAARLGGVAGHAGLYGSALDLARYAQLWLNLGRTGDGRQLMRPGRVRAFIRRGPGNRALGWEMRDTAATDDTGAALSAQAFGHGGYTGVSLWVDPTHDLFVVLLTNRVFAPRVSRSITRLKAIRAQVAGAAVALRAERCRMAAC